MVSEGNSGTACDVASNVFNSELGSNYLAHYGLDGPLAEYQPPPSEYGNDVPDEPSEVLIYIIRFIVKNSSNPDKDKDKRNHKYLYVSPMHNKQGTSALWDEHWDEEEKSNRRKATKEKCNDTTTLLSRGSVFGLSDL